MRRRTVRTLAALAACLGGLTLALPFFLRPAEFRPLNSESSQPSELRAPRQAPAQPDPRIADARRNAEVAAKSAEHRSLAPQPGRDTPAVIAAAPSPLTVPADGKSESGAPLRTDRKRDEVGGLAAGRAPIAVVPSPPPIPMPGMLAPTPAPAVGGGPQPQYRKEIAPVPVLPAAPSVRPHLALPPGHASLERPRQDRHALLMPAEPQPQAPRAEEDRDRFDATPHNPVVKTSERPVSTFSIDVDTASYSWVRRALNAGRLPAAHQVRVEEMINYFPYDYPRPERAEAPFLPTVTVFPAPWNPANRLVHIAIKGYAVTPAERPRANLVLLIDVSGSMAPADRLPLLKNAFRMLVDELRPEDSVAIVTYASDTRTVLEPTKAADKSRIIAAIDALQAGGGTYGAGGIQRAYALAEAGFDKAAVNRIILATDGDWNIGLTNRDELKGLIARKRTTGIYLSILGVGMGNHNDALMQALAQSGNGAAAYIDTLAEARKVLVEEASSTLFPIARDVKVQVEFNPARVAEHRLIGYETRALRREDFNNDKVDAGEVGSGHAVTAIYEIAPAGGGGALIDPLRYGGQPADATAKAAGRDGEYGFVKLRYKLPSEEASRLIEVAITPVLEKAALAQVPTEVRFSTAVAAFGQLLAGSSHLGSYGHTEIAALASGAKGDDPYGYRAELVSLVRLAKSARP